jgi:hypothetical protein
MEKKPRVRFCWHCGRQLRANFYREYKAKDGHTYIVHAECREILDGESFDHKNPPIDWDTEDTAIWEM